MLRIELEQFDTWRRKDGELHLDGPYHANHKYGIYLLGWGIVTMKNEEILNRLAASLRDLNFEGAKEAISAALKVGLSPSAIIERGLVRGMGMVGQRLESREYFLSDMLVAANIMKSSIETLKPYIETEKAVGKPVGTVVIGTVKGQIHSLGKDLVALVLRVAGFNVIDLGVDVPPEKFIEKAKEVGAHIIAMSALITMTLHNMKRVIALLKREGMRNRVKVMVGGRAVTEEYAREIGADAYGRSAFDAAPKAKELIRLLKKTRTEVIR